MVYLKQQRRFLYVLGSLLVIQMLAHPVEAAEANIQPSPQILFTLPEATTQPKGMTRAEWNYSFLRGNHTMFVFNEPQTVTGIRSNHRKTHVVTWRLEHGLTDRLQPEVEIVYRAQRQHTHSDGDEHDRNDDGQLDRLFTGLSYQALQEADAVPALRIRSGLLWPSRQETEGIGQETGVDLLGALSKQLGTTRVFAMTGFAMTFDNRDHPADPIFTTPISKAHDLRTLSYGLGLTHPLTERWQANLELNGQAFDTIERNRRVHESELTLTPGVVYTSAHEGRWDSWIGFGLHIGLTEDTDRLGVAIRTGARF